MKRSASILLIGTLIAVLAACNGTTGGLGSVPTAVPTASPGPSGPDLTPAPSPSSEPSTTPSVEPDATPSTSPSQSPSSAETMIVRAYFVLGGEPGSAGLVPVLRVVPKSAGVAAAAMRALLAGPMAAESGDSISTGIPAGTQLLGVTIKNNVATVDLSTEFDSGGGSASMHYRLAQVTYTLTQFTTVKSVVFQIDGQTVTVFGSEGIELDGPVGRADFTDQLPSIFVDRPAYGAAIGNPARVTGNANVFEATFRMAILDGSGKTLVDSQVMATCGTGCRGTFDITLRYNVSKAQWGTLRAYNLSAKDGTPEDIRDYPVWLTPTS
jgi:spore germination protein GerM